MATLMLENRAEIRYIQAILGHANLQATQIYTHVSIRKLREVHAATHPRRNFASAQPPTPPATKSRNRGAPSTDLEESLGNLIK